MVKVKLRLYEFDAARLMRLAGLGIRPAAAISVVRSTYIKSTIQIYLMGIDFYTS